MCEGLRSCIATLSNGFSLKPKGLALVTHLLPSTSLRLNAAITIVSAVSGEDFRPQEAILKLQHPNNLHCISCYKPQPANLLLVGIYFSEMGCIHHIKIFFQSYLTRKTLLLD